MINIKKGEKDGCYKNLIGFTTDRDVGTPDLPGWGFYECGLGNITDNDLENLS